MEKRNLAIICLVLTSILFSVLSGCGASMGRDEPPVSPEFIATGTEGIVMTYMADQPPQKVYTGMPLTFLIEIRNRGTHTVNNAVFYLTGFDPQIIPMSAEYPLTTPLESKSPYSPDGGYTTVSFESPEIRLLESMPNYKPTFLLTACYPYQTVATPLVCVDPNPQDTISDKACRTERVYGTGSQGAPVAVQSVETESNPKSMFFRIHIANVGGGEGGSGIVFSDRSLNLCPGQLTYRDLNVVRYSVKLGDQEITHDCQPSNQEVRLVNGQAVIFCQYQHRTDSTAYQTPLNVRLEYAYKNSISKMVNIENLDYAR